MKRTILLPLIALSLVFTLDSCKKKGCMDDAALNYDEKAKKDDGSCTFADHGDVTVVISHVVGDDELHFDHKMFTNAAGNKYSVTKLRYFISDITFNGASGTEDYNSDGEHYIDGQDSATLSHHLHDIPNGTYESISITFGLNEEKNIPGYFNTQPETIMEWPMMMGGGYHYMQMEGRYDSSTTEKFYNTHLGIGREIVGNDTTFHQNFYTVELHNSAITVEHDSWYVTLEVDLNGLYDAPNVYDFNDWGQAIMANHAAQAVLKENGADGGIFHAHKISTEDPGIGGHTH